jgi:hypothetical protein
MAHERLVGVMLSGGPQDGTSAMVPGSLPDTLYVPDGGRLQTGENTSPFHIYHRRQDRRDAGNGRIVYEYERTEWRMRRADE